MASREFFPFQLEAILQEDQLNQRAQGIKHIFTLSHLWVCLKIGCPGYPISGSETQCSPLKPPSYNRVESPMFGPGHLHRSHVDLLRLPLRWRSGSAQPARGLLWCSLVHKTPVRSQLVFGKKKDSALGGENHDKPNVISGNFLGISGCGISWR